jgi:signal transduction histidine kinase
MIDSMRRDPLERLTIRAALIVGFGLTLGLWLSTGYVLTRRMNETEDRQAEVTRRYMQAQDLISAVRSQVNLSSIVLRDALLDPSASEESRYVARLNDSYAAIHKALDAFQPVIESPTEPQQIERLRSEIAEFRQVTFQVLEAFHGDRSTPASDILEQWIAPRRTAAITLSDEIRALNRTAFVQHQTANAEIHAEAERQWWLAVALALIANLGIAFVAIRYAGRLENRLRRQRDKDAQNSRELQQLSARLVAAQEEERRNIARELHDEVGQALTAIKVDLQLAMKAIDSQRNPGRTLEELQQLTDGAINTVRDLSHLLRPTMLDDLGLPAAIDWLLRGLARRHQIDARLVQEGMDTRLDPDTEVAAYRIVQEALTNVARHAHATRCTVRLTRRHDVLDIAVEDDGVGFHLDAAGQRGPGGGLGLVGLRERVNARQGTLAIESAPNRGTRLMAKLPTRALEAPPAVEDVDLAFEQALSSPGAQHG